MNPDTKLCHQQQGWPLPDRLPRQHPVKYLKAPTQVVVLVVLVGELAAAAMEIIIEDDFFIRSDCSIFARNEWLFWDWQ